MNYSDVQKRNAFKPIKENPIVLDFTGCRYLGEIHLILKEKFGLPEFYGENWDALWDSLDDRFYSDEVCNINISGYATLSKELRDECIAMLEIFEEIQKEKQNVVFKIIS